MALVDQVQEQVKEAMKARAAERLSVLRMLLSDLKKAALDADDGLSEEDEIAIVRRGRKQRLEAAEAFAKAGRDDSAAKEKDEAKILEEYLPAQLGDDELAAAVADIVAATGASSMRDMGKVMGPLMRRFAGKLDGDRARQAAQTALNSGEADA